MADFIADSYRAATGADVALVNGGAIRADTIVNRGEVTRRDVLSIVPFNNRLVKIEIAGAVLRAALEHSVGSFGVETEPGRFAQVSGIRYAYDARRDPGKRLTSVTVNGKPLDDKQSYTLVTNSYVALKGGDGYNMFRGAKVLIDETNGPPEADVLIKAIASMPSIAPRVDGRITRADQPKDANSCP
jgi:5'-nucleotidase